MTTANQPAETRPAKSREVEALIAREGLPATYHATVDRTLAPLAARIAADHRKAGRPIVVGFCGSQGSGKSTFAAFLDLLLQAQGLSVAVLSVDDLYLGHAERGRLASEVHPLLATRGPPGTHDVELGMKTLDALTRPAGPHRVALPRFDKAEDGRSDPAGWPTVEAPVDVVLFEGWFVGARAQPLADLAEPVNRLEREDDPDGAWRGKVNTALADDYSALFARIDLLVLLQAPGFGHVHAWRSLQERKLAARLAAEGRTGEIMDDAALRRFIMHYERLTRWILQEMPQRADVVVRLGSDHEITGVDGL